MMTSLGHRSSSRSPRSGKTAVGRRLRRHNKGRKRGGSKKTGFAKRKCALCRGEARMILGGLLHCGKPHATRPGWK